MSTQWYYAHDDKKLGPFSQQQLKEMAAAGTILPTDMVWLEGVAQGAPASQIKNLFPHKVNSTAAIDEALAEEAASAPVEATPPEKPETPKPPPKAPQKRKGRAQAVKGCDIVSQDGSHARYRKKCTVCGHIDSATHSLVISNRLTKGIFFCPKCRKRRDVVIQCRL